MTAVFLAANRIYTEGVCKLMDLAISDLSDEDYILNKRKHPIPALLYGAFALLSRFGQSLAPVFGFWAVSHFAKSNISDASLINSDTHDNAFGYVMEMGVKEDGTSSSSDNPIDPLIRTVAFRLLVLTPILAAMTQILAWTQVTLRGKHLQGIKSKILSSV
eukprot:CAMPEP_0184506304 /NCGR_PEP_ID=MMETSP0113_2-20130426/53430_1 /TAXON_ID=91329 /ORGANISM="Norrisiella sphaerica, Strain BC52" /LENGTH=160 /DNA_ID=CAMNT_0026896017 /DNA_START=802 /DNA_END=1284 /DNA_ORIENTATION=+